MKLDSIVEILSIARSLQTGPSLRRFLPKLVALTALGLVASIFLALLLGGGIYALWQQLQLDGWERQAALWAALGGGIGVLLVLLIAMAAIARRLRGSIFPSGTQVERIAQAFIEGLQTPSQPK